MTQRALLTSMRAEFRAEVHLTAIVSHTEEIELRLSEAQPPDSLVAGDDLCVGLRDGTVYCGVIVSINEAGDLIQLHHTGHAPMA